MSFDRDPPVSVSDSDSTVQSYNISLNVDQHSKFSAFDSFNSFDSFDSEDYMFNEINFDNLQDPEYEDFIREQKLIEELISLREGNQELKNQEKDLINSVKELKIQINKERKIREKQTKELENQREMLEYLINKITNENTNTNETQTPESSLEEIEADIATYSALLKTEYLDQQKKIIEYQHDIKQLKKNKSKISNSNQKNQRSQKERNLNNQNFDFFANRLDNFNSNK
ncbi:hypothetical protein M0811_09937 [Anaeramoeba ignava]|uniref:Uncharacterized protein n=1 Tax=Anaeramoeba ignava TaxID=1746090 RepID=A0A9Q0LF72_ANAIG|nr:hypothetical protein M0811_09937 [Anaeramoeba ignava]